jgi:TonB family protein
VDALGDGDTTVALVVVHPSPKPDLSQLPSGTSGDVIVDVVIDKDGKIAKYTMMRGLGHGVDQTVLATIQQWTFQPATRNGIPWRASRSCSSTTFAAKAFASKRVRPRPHPFYFAPIRA